MGGALATAASKTLPKGSIAVCDTDAEKRALAKKNCALEDDGLFSTDEEFFSKGKLADVLIIASMDQCHYKQAVNGLKLGYHLILEKPIAQSTEECLEIARLAHEYQRKVYVCHVLRYAPLYTTIKKISVIKTEIISIVITRFIE